MGGICCDSHLAVTYGAELLYLRIFPYLSPPSKPELPFLHGLITRAYWLSRDESHGNNYVRRQFCQIKRYNNSPPYVTGNMAATTQG